MTIGHGIEVAMRVQRKLDERDVRRFAPRVMTDEVWLSGMDVKLWYIPFEFVRVPDMLDVVYAAFSDVEEAMEEEGVEVLLVPRAIETAAAHAESA